MLCKVNGRDCCKLRESSRGRWKWRRSYLWQKEKDTHCYFKIFFGFIDWTSSSERGWTKRKTCRKGPQARVKPSADTKWCCVGITTEIMTTNHRLYIKIDNESPILATVQNWLSAVMWCGSEVSRSCWYTCPTYQESNITKLKPEISTWKLSKKTGKNF